MTFATDGLITRIHEVGASDKLVNIVTPDRGRIGVMVKGGRSPNSKLTPISQLFTYGNFEIYEKNSMYWLRGGSILRSFYELSIDIERIAVATYLCDLANELTDADEECAPNARNDICDAEITLTNQCKDTYPDPCQSQKRGKNEERGARFFEYGVQWYYLRRER